MDLLVRILILSACVLHNCIGHDKLKKSLFSWSSEAEVKESTAVPGYLPPLTVHKYHGVQINPVNGLPIYLSGSNNPQSGDALSVGQYQKVQLPPEYSSQLELLNNVITFLPDEGTLQDSDVAALLPYTDLFSEDALAHIQFSVESEKSPNESKLLKLIGFLRYLKELKLMPFKVAANFGASLLNKKKQLLHLGELPITTPSSISYPLSEHYPIHHPGVRPAYYVPSQSFIPLFPIHSSPLSNDVQRQQQFQQPAAPPRAANSDNRVDPNFGHQQIHTYSQITPASTLSPYPHHPAVAPPKNDFDKSLPHLSYLEQYQSPSSYQPRYQYSSSVPATAAPYQQPSKMRPDDPYPSISSIPLYQTTEQPAVNFQYQNFQDESPKYSSTPADTHASGDLAGSASDNIEKMKENFASVVNLETPVIRKEEHSVAKTENHHTESSVRPNTTKLRVIETKPPVVVYPATPAVSKSTDSQTTSLPQPLTTSSSGSPIQQINSTNWR